MKATPKIAMMSPTSVTGYFQGSMVATGILMPYEVMVPTVEPGSVLVNTARHWRQHLVHPIPFGHEVVACRAASRA
jgi:hypothetical protein